MVLKPRILSKNRLRKLVRQRSLGLSAYRTLSRRLAPATYACKQRRPKGELIWIYAAEVGNIRAINDFARRLIQTRPGCHVLITTLEGTVSADADMIICAKMPSEHPDATDAFVDHWKPDVVIWTWGGLLPNLVLSAANSEAFMMLIDAESDGFDSRRDRWLPEVLRHLIAKFETVIVRSKAAHLRMAQLGRALDTIQQTIPLQPFGRVLPAAESDLSDITHSLAGRPLWLATQITRDEINPVLIAYRQALMAAHRLLLVLDPASRSDVEHAQALGDQSGLRLCRWGIDDLPNENTQILLADPDAGQGLWFRMASVTFLGGSLSPNSPSADPYVAAAHGSAIIYGPHVRPHVDAYTRLMNAGAARIVNDAATLGRAVTQMMAPDQAAQMAVAGWNVVTEGADSLDKIIAIATGRLDALQDGIV